MGSRSTTSSSDPPARLVIARVGNRSTVDSADPEFPESPNDTGGVDDTLRPAEALDADDVRNDDGDEVVDPPEDWAAADHIAEEPDGESLDEKLAAEEPEPPAQPTDEGVAMDRIDPADHGTEEGQISGSPEDGDSLFPIVE
nr:hypothetical protein [Mycobacterium sp. OAS707]